MGVLIYFETGTNLRKKGRPEYILDGLFYLLTG